MTSGMVKETDKLLYTQWFGVEFGEIVKTFPPLLEYTESKWEDLLKEYDGKKSQYGNYIYIGVDLPYEEV